MKKRNELVTVWMTPKEKAILKQMADEQGVSLSDILRADIERRISYEKYNNKESSKKNAT